MVDQEQTQSLVRCLAALDAALDAARRADARLTAALEIACALLPVTPLASEEHLEAGAAGEPAS
jgi:hypothetical protein